MRNSTPQAPRSGQVRAVYNGTVQSFALKRGATFRDLADRLAQIEAQSGHKPIALDVKFDA